MEFTYKPLSPLDEERYLGNVSRAYSSPFRATFGQTLNLLKRELEHLRAANVIIQLALQDADIRLDGHPRSSARPRHPGVLLSFDSKHGPLRYGTAAYYPWGENLRAIALALEALRKVDRYGVTRRGEQYAGWKALPAGGESGAGSIERGRALVDRHGGLKEAMRACHPDQGGDPQEWRDVLAYREAMNS